MRCRPFLPALLAMLAPASAAHANAIVPPAQPSAVARSALSVTPDREWNRMSLRPGPLDEVWTLDGEPLNALTFYAGLAGGDTLFRDARRQTRPLPAFAVTMLPTDLPALLEESYRIARGTTAFSVDRVAPARFAGAAGVRFEYSFVRDGEGLHRRGEGYAAIVGGRLYMATFEAPALHFFDHDVAAARAAIATARIGAAPAG